MYQVQFSATTSANWAEAIELTDAATNLPLHVPDDAVFHLTVEDRCRAPVLRAASDEGTIVRPQDHIIQWTFSATDMGALCSGSTYPVGLTMTTDAGTTQLLIGSLALLDGIV